jgi:hypothetical protein
VATKTIPWLSGGGNITITYAGIGNDSPTVGSSANEGVDRSQTLTWKTTSGVTVKTVTQTIRQAGTCEAIEASDGVLTDSDAGELWALK